MEVLNVCYRIYLCQHESNTFVQGSCLDKNVASIIKIILMFYLVISIVNLYLLHQIVIHFHLNRKPPKKVLSNTTLKIAEIQLKLPLSTNQSLKNSNFCFDFEDFFSIVYSLYMFRFSFLSV